MRTRGGYTADAVRVRAGRMRRSRLALLDAVRAFPLTSRRPIRRGIETVTVHIEATSEGERLAVERVFSGVCES